MLKVYQKVYQKPSYNPEVKEFTFNGGEEYIKVDLVLEKEVIIETILDSSSEIMKLLMLTDALRRKGVEEITLLMPYVPYARQDRVCNAGEALSIKVFADIINNQMYDKVVIFDPHSDVAGALIDNVVIVKPTDLFDEEVFGLNHVLFDKIRLRNITIVSPDAGANKKCYDFSKTFGGIPVVRADKIRDVSTGDILETTVYCSNFYGADVLILDDICDGGRTFIELAKVLKTKNVGKIYLYISHGIFSKGLDVFDGYIDHVTTTNSFFYGKEYGYNVEVIDVFDLLRKFV